MHGNKDTSAGAVCRSRPEVERQHHRLWLLDQLQLLSFVEDELDLELISTDPSLKEDEIRHLGHTTLVPAAYLDKMKAAAELARKELPKKLLG